MQRTSRRLIAGLLLPLALTGAIAGCGDDSGDGATAKPTSTPHDMAGMGHEPDPNEASIATSPDDKTFEPSSDGEKVDQAFVRQMTPHHLGAVLMSTIAVQRAKRPKLQRFATGVVQDQTKELATLQRLGSPLGLDAGTSKDDGTMAKDMKTLGVPDDARTMSADMLGSTTEPFKDVKDRDFDRAFVDAMIEHHEGAVVMAKVEQERGSNQEIKDLARDIEKAQEKELETLRTWQRHW